VWKTSQRDESTGVDTALVAGQLSRERDEIDLQFTVSVKVGQGSKKNPAADSSLCLLEDSRLTAVRPHRASRLGGMDMDESCYIVSHCRFSYCEDAFFQIVLQ
jgi:hypothetical protein